MGSRFYFICLYFNASTILFWLPQLCNIVCNQKVWFLQLYPSLFRLLWLCRVFCGSIQFLDCFSISVKNARGTLMEIILNLLITLGSMDILSILIPPVCESEISFHLFVSSSKTLWKSYGFQCSQIFSLVKFIIKCFILCAAIVNGIVSHISFIICC